MLPDTLGKLATDFKSKEDQEYSSLSPTAVKTFSKASLNLLVGAYNKLAPIFGLQEPIVLYPADATRLSTDLVKGLMMVKSAVDDAVSEDILDSSDSFTISDITNDLGIKMLAARLDKLAKDRMFRKWLSDTTEDRMTEEKPEELPEVAPPEGSVDVMSQDNMIDMLSKRIKG